MCLVVVIINYICGGDKMETLSLFNQTDDSEIMMEDLCQRRRQHAKRHILRR